MSTYTTEITSETISSDNPIHQRLLKAYYLARPYVKGDLLEVGCGEGRGVDLLAPKSDSYTALDKIQELINKLKSEYPQHKFIQTHIPPFNGLPDNHFDTVVSFQVIEHIKDDRAYLEEIYRVMKPGATALITTPNIKMTLTRNPWHIREYTPEELSNLASKIFERVEIKGITGNEKVMEYYTRNKKAVEKITRFDIFNLQYRLPSSVLRVPYEILNRMNRKGLETENDSLVRSIRHEDYILSENPDESLDLFLILRKQA